MFNKTVDDAHHADWDGSRLICDGLRLHARTPGAARWGAQCLPSYSLTRNCYPQVSSVFLNPVTNKPNRAYLTSVNRTNMTEKLWSLGNHFIYSIDSNQDF